MGWFSRFKRKKPLDPIDLGLIGTDMHSHLIPGIDDGSPEMAATIAMLRHFKDLGYKKVITTPHIMSDYYRNTTEIIREGCAAVRAEIAKRGLEIDFDAAAEYYLDDHFDRLIDNNDLLTMGDRMVLFELPFMAAPDMMKSVLFKLQMAGYRPVLAHPERYTYWHKETHRYRELVDRDVYLQLNINSLTGAYGLGVQKCAEWLVDQGLVSFAGSDCHHPGHLEMLTEARTTPHLHKLIESGALKNSLV